MTKKRGLKSTSNPLEPKNKQSKHSASNDHHDPVVINLDHTVSSKLLSLKFKLHSFLVCEFSNHHLLYTPMFDLVGFEMIKDHQIVIELLKHYGEYFFSHLTREELAEWSAKTFKEQAPKELLSNKWMVKKILEFNGNIGLHMSNDAKKDPEIMLKAWEKCPKIKLKEIPIELLENVEFMINLFKGKSHNMKDELRGMYRLDKRVFIELFKRGIIQFNELPHHLKNDMQVFLHNLSVKTGLAYDDSMSGKSIVMQLLDTPFLKSLTREEIAKFPNELMADKEITLKILKSKPELFSEFRELRDNREFMVQVCEINNDLFEGSILASDKKFMLQILQKNGNQFSKVDPKLKKDKEIVLTALKQNNIYYLIPEELKQDNDVIVENIRHDPSFFNLIPFELKTRELILSCLSRNGSILSYLPDLWKNDREAILLAVKQNGNCIKFATEHLRNDREIVLEAVKTNSTVLCYLSNEMRSDREIVLEASKIKGTTALEYCAEEFRSDREIVKYAVQSNCSSLSYASPFQGDREIVMLAVKCNGEYLKYASDTLRSDKEIVTQAVKTNGRSIQYASDEMRQCKEIILQALNSSYTDESLVFNFIPQELRNDQSFMLQILKQNGTLFSYTSDMLKSNIEFMLEALKIDAKFMNYSPLKNDVNFLLKAIEINDEYMLQVSESLKNDKSFVLKALQVNPRAYSHIDNSELRKDSEMFLMYLRHECSRQHDVSDPYYRFVSWREDREVMIEAVGSRGFPLSQALVRMDSDFLLRIVEKNESLLLEIAVFDPIFVLDQFIHHGRRSIDIKPVLANLEDESTKVVAPFVLELIKIYPQALKYVSYPDLFNDRSFMKKCCETHLSNFQYASHELREDESFLREVLDSVGNLTERELFSYVKIFTIKPQELDLAIKEYLQQLIQGKLKLDKINLDNYLCVSGKPMFEREEEEEEEEED